MKRFLVVLLLVPLPALANPFIVSDPVDPRTTHCGVVMDGAAKLVIAVTVEGTNKICKHDLQGLPAGSHTVTMTAIGTDPILGSMESPPSSPPFTFALPSLLTAPAGLQLLP